MQKKILVFGDAILDEYIRGDVHRVSPEAPVPVLNICSERYKLGGACNVSENIAALGAEVAGVYLIGDDAAGDEIMSLSEAAGITTEFVLREAGVGTIRKIRVVAGSQQIARLDYSDVYSCSAEIQTKMTALLKKGITWADAVVISDYNKGTCIPDLCRFVITESRKQNKIVIVDPKGTNWKKYQGANFITPNMKEINLYSGLSVKNEDAAVESKYSMYHKKIGVDHLLLTRSEKGMSLIDDMGVTHIPAEGKEVFDVSGAGDTVVAAMAVMLDADLGNVAFAIRAANVAAGIVIGKVGTAVVTLDELELALYGNDESLEKKVFDRNEYDALKALIRCWRVKGETVATTNGCFDILHCGHIRLLNEAAEKADHLVVAVNSDASVKRLKGEQRPVNGEMDRAFVMASIRSVDAVLIFDPMDNGRLLTDDEWEKIPAKLRDTAKEAPMGVLKMIMPDVHIKGGDYTVDQVPEAVFAKKFTSIQFVDGYSTTKTIEKIQSEHEEASE